MTALELYDATLIELNKVNAPTFTIEQWNYFINKAIQAYCDRRYNFYAMNQQLTDDLRVLLSTYNVFNPDFTKQDSGSTVTGWDGTGSTDTIHTDDLSPFDVGNKIMFGIGTRVYTILELIPGTPDKIKFTPTFYFTIEAGGGSDPGPQSVGSLASNDIEEGVKIYIVNRAYSKGRSLSFNEIYSFFLEDANYYHLLAVRAYWTDVRMANQTTFKCDPNQIKSVSRMYPAKRLTYDMLANIENNAYLKPMYRQPYHQIHDHYLNLGTEKITEAVGQFQNTPEIEVHAGQVPEGITLQMIEVDYLKLPEKVTITDNEVYVNTTDASQLLEWPDYLDSELIKFVVSYFLENAMNPRVQTHSPLNEDTPAAPLEFGVQQ